MYNVQYVVGPMAWVAGRIFKFSISIDHNRATLNGPKSDTFLVGVLNLILCCACDYFTLELGFWIIRFMF